MCHLFDTAMQTALDDEEFGLDMGTEDLASSTDAVASQPVAEVKAAAPVVVKEVPAVVKAVVAAPAAPVAAPAAAPVAAPVATPKVVSAPSEDGLVEEPVPAVDVSAAEALLLKRAARFGIQPVPAVQAKVEESRKNQRAERFGLPKTEAEKPNKGAANINAKKGNNNNAGNSSNNKKVNSAVQAVIEDPEMTAKLLQRANRFGVVSNTLQQVQKVQVQAEEVSLQLTGFT